MDLNKNLKEYEALYNAEYKVLEKVVQQCVDQIWWIYIHGGKFVKLHGELVELDFELSLGAINHNVGCVFFFDVKTHKPHRIGDVVIHHVYVVVNHEFAKLAYFDFIFLSMNAY